MNVSGTKAIKRLIRGRVTAADDMRAPSSAVLRFDESGYIEDAGIEVGDAFSLEASDNQAVAALDPEDLTFHWKRLDLRD